MTQTILAAAAASLALAIYPFAGYPLLLRALSRALGNPVDISDDDATVLPSCSFVIAVHNGESLMVRKITNTLAIDYPADLLQIIVVCDGCDDNTPDIARSFGGSRIDVIELRSRCGKNRALNAAVARCTGEILVFSDVDALLEPDALLLLSRWFSIPSVGGVVGHKRIGTMHTALDEAQRTYIGMQDSIRSCEARLHSCATNEGKLHAIYRSCWADLPPQGCDDFLNLLQVVACQKRFMYEPRAVALIAVPSCDIATEVARRRRIVKGSMAALWRYRRLFNPLRSGWFAFMLWSHKLGRRLSPVFAIIAALLLSAEAVLMLVQRNISAVIILPFIAAGIAGTALLIWFLRSSPNRTGGRFIAKLRFFIIGNWGTLRGVVDFLTGTGNAVYWSTKKRVDSIEKR